MNKPWKVILVFLGVFLAGAVFGGFVSIRLARHWFRDSFRPPAMEQFVPMILRKYSARLELTPGQLEQIRPIVRSADEELHRLRRNNFAATIAVAEKMNADIAALLTPEQQQKLQEMKEEWRERWKLDRLRRNRERNSPPPAEGRPGDAPPPGNAPPPAPPS